MTSTENTVDTAVSEQPEEPQTPAHIEEDHKKKSSQTGSTKQTFMLHCPFTRKSLAKLCASSDRYAALKCASRMNKLPENLKMEDGSIRILLRKTNSKIVREFKGNVITLETPQEVYRQGRKIVYTKKPTCKLVRKLTWEELESTNPPSEDAPLLA